MNCFHDYLNDTPIITAINCCRNLELIKYLVRNGADVNYRNKVNYTPLMYACIKGV
ncbi:ankyrin repeat domain-containing protein [Brachyspira innocens]|uniref:ankyrin repeat domain-containing protein n=1 Tax=Brachyspira innocens TaxID=13264 RepID=UPI0026F0E2B1|nr:ankyrin repeat domain-containing protein [Brachyspira innocens]